jgi:tRNA(Ile)-lysidine synthase
MDPAARACLERVRETLRHYLMLAPAETTLVAVSGGVDSVCLLHILHTLGYRLEVAHFDHQTRNGQSQEDAVFVRDMAARLSLPFHLETRPVEQEARAAGCSFEEYARTVRYDFLLRTATARHCAAAATAHHADDQVETILLRLLRGTTPHGLAGIPPVRVAGGVRIVRPLLACTRGEIQAYVAAHDLPYRTDPSNADPRYVRNRIRHDLLPHLAREYNPHVREALLRLAETQRLDNEFLDGVAQSSFATCYVLEHGLDRRRFAALAPAIQHRVILRLAWQHGVECPYERVRAAARFVGEGPTGKRFDLGGGISLRNARSVTEIGTSLSVTDDSMIALQAPGVTRAFDRFFRVIELEGVPGGAAAAYCTPGRQVFDADGLGTPLIVRHRRRGDRFTPYGMTGTKKLQDYFVDIGLPASQRDAQLLLLGAGRIGWIVGHAISVHVAVTPRSRRLMEIEVTHAP